MACPLGCINVAGQPKINPTNLSTKEKGNILVNTYKRANALYSEDEKSKIRQSHNNPQIIELYKNFLNEPGSHKAHELLHTTYNKNNNK